MLDHAPAAVGLHPQHPRPRRDAHALGKLGAREQQRRTVIGRVAAGASSPAATAARYTGSRWASPSRCTDRLPSSSPSPRTASGVPALMLIPPSNQHIAPALSPASTTPAVPGAAQRRVDAVLAPHREHVAHRSTADVDRVLREQVRDRDRSRSRARWNSDRMLGSHGQLPKRS